MLVSMLHVELRMLLIRVKLFVPVAIGTFRSSYSVATTETTTMSVLWTKFYRCSSIECVSRNVCGYRHVGSVSTNGLGLRLWNTARCSSMLISRTITIEVMHTRKIMRLVHPGKNVRVSIKNIDSCVEYVVNGISTLASICRWELDRACAVVKVGRP